MSLPMVRSPAVRSGGMESAVIDHPPEDNPYYLDPFYDKMPMLAGMDWFIRFWRYFDSRLSAIRYYIAASSFYGGILFMIGSFSQAIPQVVDRATGSFDCSYAWLVVFTYFIGTYLFTSGCFLLTVEAINREFPDESAAFKAGQRPTKPEFRVLRLASRNLAWWAGVTYTFGAILYNVGATITFADLWDSITVSQKGMQWLEIWPFFFGGFFFLTSGLLYLIEFSRNPLRGMLPFIGNSSVDRRTFTWWVNCCNFWGGVGFCMSGFWNWKTFSISKWHYRIENIVGFGIGAFMFTLAGLLLFIQMSLARCTSPKVDPRPECSKVTSSFSDSQVPSSVLLNDQSFHGTAGGEGPSHPSPVHSFGTAEMQRQLLKTWS